MGFKDLYGVGGAPGVAGGDVEFYTGKIQSWDEATGANTVLVNGVAIPNLNVLQTGLGIQYQAGDVVDVRRVQTVYSVMGKVAAPGASAAGQVVSNAVSAQQSTASTSYTDLATYGPEVTTYIGSSRRALVIFSANVQSLANAGTPTLIYIGGTAAVQVSGASTIAANPYYCGGYTWYATASAPVGFQQVSTQITLLTAAQGLNQGFNTFTLKYRAISTNPGAVFADRNISVIPF